MNTVVTPAARAWAMIAGIEPPLDLLTYQIHMPWPSNAPAPTAPTFTGEVGFAIGGCSGRLETTSGP